jgi:hypothetical protein
MEEKPKKASSILTGLGLIGIGAFLWTLLYLVRHYYHKRYLFYRVIPAEYIVYFLEGVGIILLISGIISKLTNKKEINEEGS